MALSIDRVAIPAITRTLNSLNGILAKGEQYAKDNNIDPTVLVNARLSPDMHPLKRQVQMVTDTARRVLTQLAGGEVAASTDDEETFAELQARVQSTIDFVSSFDAASLHESEDKIITLPLGDAGLDLDGCSFLMGFAMPNFYFHVTTAYNILRHNGVPVGKMDFLGAP